MPDMSSIPFLVSPNGPAWLPAAAKDARQFAYWGQLIMIVMFLLSVIVAIFSFAVGAWPSGVYMLISAIVIAFLFYMIGKSVFEPLDQGRFKEASDHLIIWGIIGLIFGGVIVGILLLIAFVRLQEVFPPQYQQYPTQYYQQPQQYPQQAPPVQQPQGSQQYQGQYQAPVQQPQYQAPPPAAPPVAPAPAQESQPPSRAEMIKCKNCGVQYPAFMRNCPNCGTPRQ